MNDDSEDWIDDLVEEIREVEQKVKELEDRKPAALSELKAVIQRDVERLDKELYDGKKILEITQHQNDSADFIIVSRAGPSLIKMNIWLLPDEYLLMYSLLIKNPDDSKTREQGTSTLKISADYGGGISYEDSYNEELSLDELSKLLIEPVVKAGSGLKFG